MIRLRTRGLLVSICGVAYLGFIPPALAQKPPSSVRAEETRPEIVVLQALRSDPITAPYRIATAWRNGQVVLSGRVGTKQVHDTAVRIGIACGYSIRDDLKIDTSEVHRLAATQMAMNPLASPAVPLGSGPYAAPYYVYPPPLFGRIDNPFYGFEPPLLSYPPWWGMVAAREPITLPAPGTAEQAAPGPVDSTVDPNAASPIKVPVGSSPEAGTVEMTIDTRGVAVLRGTVPTLNDRVAIGQRIKQVPGVAEVINLLNVGAPSGSASPPPPPLPANPSEPNAPGRPEPPAIDPALQPAISADNEDLSKRLSRAFLGRPALASLPIKVSVRDGVAYLSGEVPTVYEAMLAFRAAQQTPGIREVDDRLHFVVPDGERKNPLQQKGRPEDVEPYLTAQIRRQVGDVAHVDQVRLQGDSLEIKGTLLRQEDRARLEAILRSMPILRGFRLESNFVVD